MQTNDAIESLWLVLDSRDRTVERLRRHCEEVEQQRAALEYQLRDANARIDRLQRDLDDLRKLGPTALGLARRFHAVAGSFPRLRRIVKRFQSTG